jgi:hypothetical protein
MKRRIEKIFLFLLLSIAGVLTFIIWKEEQDILVRKYEWEIRDKRLLYKKILYYDRARESIEPFPEFVPDKKGPLTLEDITLFS